MKIIKSVLFFSFLFNIILSSKFACPNKKNPPKKIVIDNTTTITPTFNGKTYSIVKIKNRIFTRESPSMSIDSRYNYNEFCPQDFQFPTKEMFQSLINDLGKDAYSVLTDEKGFNMTNDTYYVTRNSSKWYIYYFMHLDGKKVKLEEMDSRNIGARNINLRCIFSPPNVNLIYPDYKGDIKNNVSTTITTNGTYFNGYLWKVDEDQIYNTKSIKFISDKSGIHKIEFWGNLLNDIIVYICDFIFVKKKSISRDQTYNDKYVKTIYTNITLIETTSLHFAAESSPVAPRIDGGYYIGIVDKTRYLHILSFDNNDTIIKDFNTTDYSIILDLIATDYGFAYYAREIKSSNHSYMKLYNKDFELINSIDIMNNKITDDIKKPSDLSRQIMKYGSTGIPNDYMRFMYRPMNGKLIYSHGRIFLIFAYYNYRLSSGGHTGDSVVTFNDLLKDMDFGEIWGSSHSLVQSATFDEFYFVTAVLGDAYPEGILVTYTSKTNFSDSYDSINKKYNSRIYKSTAALTTYIKGYMNGNSDGMLGGIVYFEKLGLYCIVYANCPYKDGNKTVLNVTTWKFVDGEFTSVNIKLIKQFSSNDYIQVKAGRIGEDKLFIMYANFYTKNEEDSHVYIIQLPGFTYIKKDAVIKGLLINWSEDLRTFDDGVLIWASANRTDKTFDKKLIINKIGLSRLTENNDDITYKITKKDLVDYNKEMEEGTNDKKGSSNSGLKNFGIAVGIIFGFAILGIAIFIIWRYIKIRKYKNEPNITLKGPILR